MAKKDFNTVTTQHDSLSEDELMGKPGKKSTTGDDRQKVSYFFDRDLWKELGKVAIDKDTTRTELIHIAVKEWLDRNE